jgi:hypothetical protein
MTITFKCDNDIIVYALEKVIDFARIKGYIFEAQCVGRLASNIGLEQELINYIDNLRVWDVARGQQHSLVLRDNQLDPVPQCLPRQIQQHQVLQITYRCEVS